MMLRVAAGPALLGYVMATVAGCGSNGSGAPALRQLGVPHCLAAETAAAGLQQSEQQNPTVSWLPPSGSSLPSPAPTTGSPPPTPTPIPTALPTVVTATTLRLGPAELSRYPSAQYVVRVGTVVDVELPDEPAPFCWSIPTSSAASVLEVVVQSDDLGGGAHVRFLAIAPGVVTVATTNACYTFPVCEAPVAIARAVVTVRT